MTDATGTSVRCPDCCGKGLTGQDDGPGLILPASECPKCRGRGYVDASSNSVRCDSVGPSGYLCGNLLGHDGPHSHVGLREVWDAIPNRVRTTGGGLKPGHGTIGTGHTGVGRPEDATLNRVPDCERFDREHGYCIEGPDCTCEPDIGPEDVAGRMTDNATQDRADATPDRVAEAQAYLNRLTNEDLVRLVAEGGYAIDKIGRVLLERLSRGGPRDFA